MPQFRESDLLVVQRPAGEQAGTYKVRFDDFQEGLKVIWEYADDPSEPGCVIQPILPDCGISGGIYA